MEILRTYDIAIAQLVPNAWVSILLFVATCKLKRLECTALAFSYAHIIQRNSQNCGEKLGIGSLGILIFFLRRTNPLPFMDVSIDLSSLRRKTGIGQFLFGIGGVPTKLETNLARL